MRVKINILKKEVVAEVEKIAEKLVKISEDIFNKPEIGGKEYYAVEKLTEELQKNGFIVKKNVGGLETSFTAVFNCDKKGPTLAFLCEYDALVELGHACGHNLSGVASIGAAICLSKLKKELNGRIICIGTPGEENFNGKILMAKKGVFDDVDVAMMVHAGDRHNTRLICLAADEIEFSFVGKPSHAAAAPYEGRNALDAIIMLFNSVNALRQQLKEDVRIHGIIIKGGDAVNIIPDNTEAKFNIRSQSRKYLNTVTEKVKNCARGASLQTQTRLKINYFADSCDDLLRNDTLSKEYEENILLFDEEIDREPKLLGSSDIGNVSYLVPTIHPMVKTTSKGVSLHTKQLAKDAYSEQGHRGLIIGTKALAMTGLKVLLDSDFFSNIKTEFNEKLKILK